MWKLYQRLKLDLTRIEEGKSKTVMWRGKPLFIKHRTSKEIEEAQNVDIDNLPHPQNDKDRVKNPKFFGFNRSMYSFRLCSSF